MNGRIRTLFDVATTVAILVTCAVILYTNWSRLFPPSRTPPIPTTPLSLEGATLRGNPTAPIVLIEYSDYKCPFCGKSERDVFPAIDKQFIETGKVQLAFRQHPLEPLHPGATKAAEAALCARRQGKFWQMHDALFKDQKSSDTGSIAHDIGLDEKSFGACLTGDVASQVQRDVREAEGLGLTGTPAFLIGVRQPDGRAKIAVVLTGLQSTDKFQKAFDAAGSVHATSPLYALIGGGVGLLAVFVGFFKVRERIR